MPLDYQQALGYIHSFDDPYLAALRDHGKQTWGVAGVEALLEKLGAPHRAYPTIHVAGTKGKGSTAAMTSRVLAESGLKTGLYISPHLQDWRERIQVGGVCISQEALASLVEDFKPHAEQIPGLSAFEVTTALAFWHFAREKCDVAVIEVGLGGRLDATNVVRPLVSVITSLSIDHTQLLGTTLGEIAAEKAAIIKPGIPTVSAPQMADALEVIEEHVAQAGSRLSLVGRDWLYQPVGQSLDGSQALIGEPGKLESYTVGLPGLFQIENAAVALAALREVERAGLTVTSEARRRGLAGVQWPGRLEVASRDPLVVLDSAHNPYSVEKLVESLETLVGKRPLIFVFGCMADKDVEGMLNVVMPVAQRIIFTQAALERAASVQRLLELAAEIAASARQRGDEWAQGAQPSLVAFPEVAEALQAALEHAQPDEVICVGGSLAIAGEARTALHKAP
jgi:dihydrofolate synthase/folylpolyglutamate synthase